MASPAQLKLLNAGWLTAEQVVRLVVSFFIMTLVARHLGPERFGAYAYLFSLAGLVLPLAMFGLEAIVMRRSAAEPEARDAVLGSTLAIRVTGAVAGALVAIVAVALFGGPAGVTPGLMALASLIVLAAPGETLNAWFKAREQMALVALPRIAVALMIAAAALWLVWQDAGLGAFVGLRGAEAALMALAALLTYGVVTGAVGRLRPSRSLLPAMLREGWPLLLTFLAMTVYMRVDQVMLGHMGEEAELGRYGVAVRVADIALFVPGALQATFYASLVRAHARDPRGFEDHMQRLYDAMALAAWGAMAGLGLATILLFKPVFGAGFAGGLPMVLVLLAGLPFAYLGIARNTLLTVRGWFWTAPATASLGALLNILLNAVLIPRFGGLGAAWATVISYAFAAHGIAFLLPRLRPAARRMTRALDPISATLRLYRVYRGA